MKKIIAAIAALSMCALMLTACGDKTTGDDNLTESITVSEPAGNAEAETEAKTEAEADSGAEEKTEETTSAAETEEETADTEADADETYTDIAAKYASLEEFYNADDVFDHPGDVVAGEDSYTYEFVKSFEGGSEFYMDLEAIDGSMRIVMAMGSEKLAMTIEGEAEGMDAFSNISIIIADGKMYMLDSTEKSGISMSLSEEEFAEMFSEYDPAEILSEINIDTESDLGSIMSYKVDIGGKIYTFEHDGTNGNTGMLYDPNGKVCMVIAKDADEDIPAIIFNEFSVNVPAGAFDVPAGYSIMDLSDFS